MNGPEPVDPPASVGWRPRPRDLGGRAVTWSSAASTRTPGTGRTPREAVDAELGGRSGTFDLVHAASTHGSDRYDEHLVIVPGSGAGELAGIVGSGRLVVEPDGIHRLEPDYSFETAPGHPA